MGHAPKLPSNNRGHEYDAEFNRRAGLWDWVAGCLGGGREGLLIN